MTVQRQVVRCVSRQGQSLSRRQFSDSVKVLEEETTEKDVSASVKKTAKQKLFSIDDVVIGEENKRVNNERKTTPTRGKVKLTTSGKLLKEEVPETVLNESENLEESETVKDNVDLKIRTDQSKEIDKDVENILDVDFDMAEDKTEKWNKKSAHFITPNAKALITLINRNHDPERVKSVLNSCFDRNLNGMSKNSVIICALKRLEKLGITDLGGDIEAKLQNHLDTKSDVSRMYISDLIHMSDFFIKRSDEDNKIAYTLLHELSWRLRKSNINITLDILGVVKQRLSTDKRKEVHMIGKKRLIETIENVSSPGELLSAMYLIDGRDNAWPRIEEEALIMLQSMDTVQTYRLIYLLALNRSKNVALVSRAKKHLYSRPINFDVLKLKNLFFACEVLRMKDPRLLNEMSVNMIELLEKNPSIRKSNICFPVLQSCSMINWNNKKLTNLLVKSLSETDDSVDGNKMKDSTHVSVLMSLGHFNLVQFGDFGLKLAESVKSGNKLKPKDLLNVVHSLACLQKCERQSVEEVLSRTFYSSLEDGMKNAPDYLKDNVKMKLLSLYGYLNEDLNANSTDIENIAREWRDQLQEKLSTAPLVGLARVVSEVLTDIAPLDKYTNRNIVTKYGYPIDFEIFVDKKLKAVRLDSADGMKKVWIKLLDYNGFLQGEEEPEYNGKTAMMLRHLKSEQDAAIVFVPYTDWSKYDKKIDHLLYLENKIRGAVQPEPQDPPHEPSKQT